MGIGGEYAAINSAIDELIPAKYRGRVDIAVNGTYWGGALLGTVLTLLRGQPPAGQLLVAGRLPGRPGPRASSSSSCARTCPRARAGSSCTAAIEEAEAAVDADRAAQPSTAAAPSERSTSPRPSRSRRPTTSASSPWPGRCSPTTRGGSILGATLMITQSFLYNAIFFTYALVLTKIYGVPATDTAYYFIFFALGNLLGPLTIGRLFDTIGRRKMISGTYILSGRPARRQRLALQRRRCSTR